MSIESAKMFLKRMKTDEDFANKVMACKDAELRMALVKDAGFDFTAAEVREASFEITDQEVIEVSGGQNRCLGHGEDWCWV
jgi:predicted ribosomally synthesized peptide with nif11-like leader